MFLDIEVSYNRDKDIRAIGACIQNMLLKAHAEGFGTCWRGEILNKKDEVSEYLGAPEKCKLMAVITLGSPAEEPDHGTRKKLEEFLVW